MSKYKHKTISIDNETYSKLKEYCDKNMHSIAKFVKNLILEKIDDNERTVK